MLLKRTVLACTVRLSGINFLLCAFWPHLHLSVFHTGDIYAARARGCASDAEPVTVRGCAAPFRDLDAAPRLRVRAPVITARLARDWRCECTFSSLSTSPAALRSAAAACRRLGVYFFGEVTIFDASLSAAPVGRSFAKPGAVRVVAELYSPALPPVMARAGASPWVVRSSTGLCSVRGWRRVVGTSAVGRVPLGRMALACSFARRSGELRSG